MTHPICVVCRLPIAGRYFVTDRGEHFCQHHPGVEACRFCGLVTVSADDLCATCSSSSVRSSHDVAQVAQPVVEWVVAHSGATWLRSVPLRLERPHELPDGYNGRTNFVVRGRDVTNEVVVASPMPAVDVRETVAHELGHVLLVNDLGGPTYAGDHRLTPQEEEGFCEVLRVLWIQHAAEPDTSWRIDRAMNGPDLVYSAGLRLMWQRYMASDRTVLGFRASVLGTPLAPSPSPQPQASRAPSTPPETLPPTRPTIRVGGQPSPRVINPHERTPPTRPRLNIKR